MKKVVRQEVGLPREETLLFEVAHCLSVAEVQVMLFVGHLVEDQPLEVTLSELEVERRDYEQVAGEERWEYLSSK